MTTTEASDYFKGAELEDAVLTIMGTKAMSDFLDPPTPEALDVIVTQVATELRETNADRPIDTDKVHEVAEDAIEAFWRHVAVRYPEIKSGDLDPLATYRFNSEAERVIKTWVEWNS